MKYLFLVSLMLSVLCSAQSVQTFHDYGKSKQTQRDIVSTEVNDRGIENNRDFRNLIQDGFIYGLFKVTNDHGKSDCVDQGMTVARAAGGILYKIATNTDRTEMDWFNLLEFLVHLSERCNYHATIQGLVVFKMMRDRVDLALIHHRRWAAFFRSCFMIYESLINTIDDTLVIAMAGMGFYQHMDGYNLFVIFGKGVKICYQYYIEGLVLQYLGDNPFEEKGEAEAVPADEEQQED